MSTGKRLPFDPGIQPLASRNRQHVVIGGLPGNTVVAREPEEIFPVLIHGDAAVAGQGVNQEMLNFLRPVVTGRSGTVHIVVNNQIRFPPPIRDSRSSLYCTDIFKMSSRPSYVNGTTRKQWRW
ncbi:MAG: hypothetical protein IPN64_00110 [Propionivibrio sp.]|uniref:hypothetical protein n=1 Tax=Propionivibrio sp. TaxID=2212460 RepID=UPI0025F7AF0C|nr:hypothetical protein [Propionivibrio sp.]MBK8892502.1 hypothetical protein [Propionivibrio sp.]